MTIKLETTGSRYVVRSSEGYTFDVVTSWRVDGDGTARGWTATATVQAHGLASEHGAVNHLVEPLRALLRDLDEGGL